jgi:beta-glucuronidase
MTTTGFDVQLARTADFADATTLHVPGKALRPTVLDTDKGTEARYVRIKLTGTGRVALAHVLVHP